MNGKKSNYDTSGRNRTLVGNKQNLLSTKLANPTRPFSTSCCGRGSVKTSLWKSTSKTIQKSIQAQMSNEKDYVKIDLEPRKHTVSNYFIIVLKKHVPPLPAYADRHGGEQKLVNDLHLRAYSTGPLKKSNFINSASAPALRSVFTSQCAKAGVFHAVTEFVKGHGTIDEYGYNREVLDPKYVRKSYGNSGSTMHPPRSTLCDNETKSFRKCKTKSTN